MTTSERTARKRLIAASLVSAFVVALLLSLGSAAVSALPVWSAYCLPKGEGALDLVPGLSSRDVVSEDASCVWSRATVVWKSPTGDAVTVTRSADWRLWTPFMVLVVATGFLVWRRRHAATSQSGADGTTADLIDAVALPRVTGG